MEAKTKILRIVAYAAVLLSVLGGILLGYLFGYNPTYDNIRTLFVNVMWLVPLIVVASNKAVRNAMLVSLVTCILNFCFYINSNALSLTEIGDVVLVGVCTIGFPLAWIYAYSIISSNAELTSEKRSWISLLSVFMLISVFVQFTSVFGAYNGDMSYLQSVFYTGGMYKLFSWIIRILWLIAWYKIIFSDAFAGYKEGAEKNYDYRFFNRYTLAYLVAVAVVLPILAFITLRPLNF